MIYGIVKAVDLFTVSTKEANKALDDAVSNYKSTKSNLESINSELIEQNKQIQELQSKDKLTYAEQGQLEELQAINKELALQQDIEEHRAKSASREAANKAVDAYNKQYGKYDISENKVNNLLTFNDKYGMSVDHENDISGNIAELQRTKELLNQAEINYKKAIADEIDTEYYSDELQRYINLVDAYKTQLDDSIADLSDKRIALEEEYNRVIEKRNLGESPLTTSEQNIISTYEAISAAIRLIYQYTNPSKWNSMEFSNIFNKEGIEKSKEELIDLAEAGKLDEDTISQYKNLNKAITDSEFILNDDDTAVTAFINQIKLLVKETNKVKAFDIPPLSKGEVITNINSLSEGFESLDKIMSSMKDKNPFDYALLDDKTFKNTFDGLGAAYTDFIDTISSSPKDIEASHEAFNNLVTAWISGSSALVGLSDETAHVTEAMLTNMGITNAAEVVANALANSKAKAAAEAYGLVDAETDEATAFINTEMASDEAKESIARYTLQKITSNGITLNTDGDIENIRSLVTAIGGAVTALDAYNRARQGMIELIKSSPAYEAIQNPTSFRPSQLDIEQAAWEKRNADAIKQKSQAYADSLKEAENEVKMALTTTTNYGSGNKTNKSPDSDSKGSKSKENEPTPKDFDWIERALEVIQRKRETLQKQVDDETNSYHEQIATLQELIELDEQFINVNKSAYETYIARWEEIKNQILKTFGDVEGNSLIAKIMNGDLTKEGSHDSYTDEKADVIDNAISIYDDMENADDEYEKAVEERTNHLTEQYKKRVAEVESFVAEVGASLSQAQSKLDLKDVVGHQIVESDYQDLIDLSNEQIDLYYDQIDALEDLLTTVDPLSPEYYSIQSSIASCKQAITDAEKSQAEWNEEIKNIPIRKIERYIELLKQIKQDLTNYISEQEALGINTTQEQYQQLIDISQQQITKLLEHQGLLRDKLGTYQFNSDKYNETASSLQDIDDEISELIQSQYEWNQAILQIPIDSLTKTNDTLQLAITAMDEILSDYDSALSAVNSVIDKQIEAINDLKDATSKEYEAKIKPYQDELDLLQKQNEARKIQFDLEQAQFDLDKAKSQKNNQVIRNGEVVYEADEEAIRSAQNAKNDAEYNKTVHDLENQISSLEEERDVLLEGYDAQLEKLDDIKDKWSSIVDDIKQASDVLKANDIFGTGWEDKILSGNDTDLYNSIKDLYSTLSNQKTQYEEQIASNERVAEMLGMYMELWQDGSLTYEQTMAGIRELSNEMKDGYTSLEHLDALMGISGVTDLNTLLSQIQESANASVSQFEGYMDIVKANVDAISKYTSSWEEMQQNIKDQIAALQKLAEEAAKMAEALNRHISSGGNSHKGPDINDNTYVSSGPGHSDEALAEAIEKGKEIVEYHRGGLVGEKQTPDRFIGFLSSKNLNSDEVYGKLLKDEWVLTSEQQKNLEKNIMGLLPIVSLPKFNYDNLSMGSENSISEVNITMGDLHLPDVQDPDGFAKALSRSFKPIMQQEFSKIYN